MAHEIFRWFTTAWFMTAWLLIDIIIAIAIIGKPRKPLTPTQAAIMTGINLTMVAGFIWLL